MTHFSNLFICASLFSFLLSCTPKEPDPAPAAARIATTSTFAGSGDIGYLNGTGLNAKFSYPVAITIDKSDNLYVADYGNNVIRKITPAGVVTTFAGYGQSGPVDGVDTVARFYEPTGLVVDKDGNIIVADQQNNMIRKISPNGTVTTLAGSTDAGLIDGQGTAARFYAPTGVAINSLGNIYVTDKFNNCIRMITPAGMVSTVAGSSGGFKDGIASEAQFNIPLALVFDSGDTLYVTEYSNNCVRKITPAGIVSTLAGSLLGKEGDKNGVGTAAEFKNPYGITIDVANNLYIADESNNVIRKITPAGVVSTFAGTGMPGATNGNLKTTTFDAPKGVIFDSHKNMFVTEGNGQKIRKITF